MFDIVPPSTVSEAIHGIHLAPRVAVGATATASSRLCRSGHCGVDPCTLRASSPELCDNKGHLVADHFAGSCLCTEQVVDIPNGARLAATRVVVVRHEVIGDAMGLAVLGEVANP